MKKTVAIELLGGSTVKAAKLIGAITPSAISQWPEDLPPRLVDRVIAACARAGCSVPVELMQIPVDQSKQAD